MVKGSEDFSPMTLPDEQRGPEEKQPAAELKVHSVSVLGATPSAPDELDHQGVRQAPAPPCEPDRRPVIFKQSFRDIDPGPAIS